MAGLALAIRYCGGESWRFHPDDPVKPRHDTGEFVKAWFDFSELFFASLI
jgi:hypothetical protein